MLLPKERKNKTKQNSTRNKEKLPKSRKDRICVLSEIPLNLADKNQVRKKD